MQQPRYARWSEISAKAWADFAAELGDATGYNLGQEQKGGYDLHFSEDTLYSTVARYEALKSRLDGNYPFELLGHNALRLEEPHIGPTVVGAILHHQDGHANPLQLLKALSGNVRRLGGLMLTGKRVTDVTKPNGFQVHCADGTLIESVGRVLSAGPGPWSWGRSLASRHLSGHSACKC
jgi:glycine/D-amino acid oxidase-like deaminating enzyme